MLTCEQFTHILNLIKSHVFPLKKPVVTCRNRAWFSPIQCDVVFIRLTQSHHMESIIIYDVLWALFRRLEAALFLPPIIYTWFIGIEEQSSDGEKNFFHSEFAGVVLWIVRKKTNLTLFTKSSIYFPFFSWISKLHICWSNCIKIANTRFIKQKPSSLLWFSLLYQIYAAAKFQLDLTNCSRK